MFGARYGSLGRGYYHLLTREAYKILLDYMNMVEMGVLPYLLKKVLRFTSLTRSQKNKLGTCL